jgi:hypothetical protein
VQESAEKGELPRTAQDYQPEEDEGAGEAGPEAYLEGRPFGELRVVLEARSFRGGGGVLEKNAFDLVAVAEEPFEAHYHLPVGGDVL